MIGQRVKILSSNDAQICVDVYAPYISKDINPGLKRPAIVICPGGGYAFCSEREAEPVALRFVAEGYNAFVVWYRVAYREGDVIHRHDAINWYSARPEHVWPMPQHDAAAAVAYVRNHAEQWHTDPDFIAIMGFSAGGHLAASISGLWHKAPMWREIGLTTDEVRPNATVLCYPVIVADQHAHRSSFVHLTGTTDEVVHQRFSVLNWVDELYPPTFLWHTFTDDLVPVQNSIRMSLALAEAGVLSETHIFPRGGHGLSLANDLTKAVNRTTPIPAECADWVPLAIRFLKTLREK